MPTAQWNESEVKRVQLLVTEKIAAIEAEKIEYLKVYRVLDRLLHNIDIDYKEFELDRRIRIYAGQVAAIASATGMSEAGVRKGKLH